MEQCVSYINIDPSLGWIVYQPSKTKFLPFVINKEKKCINTSPGMISSYSDSKTFDECHSLCQQSTTKCVSFLYSLAECILYSSADCALDDNADFDQYVPAEVVETKERKPSKLLKFGVSVWLHDSNLVH